MSRPSSSAISLEDPPVIPPDSPGSSVSTRLQDEYNELLKYAVVVPNYPAQVSGKPQDTRTLFQLKDDVTRSQATSHPSLGYDLKEDQSREESEEEGPKESTPRGKNNSAKTQFSDFDTSPEESSARGVGFRLPISGMFSESGRANDGTEEREVTETVYRETIDQDMGRLETLMDQWCLDLKRNILAEVAQAKTMIEQRNRQELVRETNRFSKEKAELVKELNSLKEFLHNYKQSLERKDAIISNLTNALYRQRDKMELMRNFCIWRIQHNEAKREIFLLQIARKHHQRSLMRRVLKAWFSVIYSKWRQRVEKACQKKAQEMLLQLTADYEAKIAALNEALEACKEEIRRLRLHRENYEDAMKKAFMRGVCALNLEAMSVFQGEDDQQQGGRPPGEHDFSDNFARLAPDKGSTFSKSIPGEPTPASDASDSQSIKVVTSQGSKIGPASTVPRQTSAKQLLSTVPQTTWTSSRAACRSTTRSLSPTLRPPMASVVVERHHPVNKQTIGHATALRYPKPASDNDKFQRLAGQEVAGKGPPIQTMRVVE